MATLSTGVELGAWAYPAGNDLPTLDLTSEQIIEVIRSNADKIDRMISAIQVKPLHIPIKTCSPR